jgi:hypothetical protein
MNQIEKNTHWKKIHFFGSVMALSFSFDGKFLLAGQEKISLCLNPFFPHSIDFKNSKM